MICALRKSCWTCCLLREHTGRRAHYGGNRGGRPPQNRGANPGGSVRRPTLCWREQDSNPRSPVRRAAVLTLPPSPAEAVVVVAEMMVPAEIVAQIARLRSPTAEGALPSLCWKARVRFQTPRRRSDGDGLALLADLIAAKNCAHRWQSKPDGKRSVRSPAGSSIASSPARESSTSVEHHRAA